jgi:hypothetical protein
MVKALNFNIRRGNPWPRKEVEDTVHVLVTTLERPYGILIPYDPEQRRELKRNSRHRRP